MSNDIPTKPGYYWAKWRIPAEGTHEANELCPSDNWELVQVNTNSVNWSENPMEDEALSVSVPGVRETQWRDCFVWGDFVLPLTKPVPASEAKGGEAEDVAKAIYKDINMIVWTEKHFIATAVPIIQRALDATKGSQECLCKRGHPCNYACPCANDCMSGICYRCHPEAISPPTRLISESWAAGVAKAITDALWTGDFIQPDKDSDDAIPIIKAILTKLDVPTTKASDQ